MVLLTRTGLTAASVMICALLGGCTHDPSSTDTTTGGSPTVSSHSTDPAQVLKTRPDLTKALADYTAMVKEIRTQLATAGLATGWTMFAQPGEAQCTEFGDVDAQLKAGSRTTGDWSATAITDADWSAALDIVKKVGGSAGFSTTEIVKDEAGDHDVFIQGPYGAVLEFGTKVKTILGVQSGCHRL